jgi:hypothetical protein
MFQQEPPPPIRVRPVWVVIATSVAVGLVLNLTGHGWGIFVATAGLLGFVVITWRDSRPEGGRLTEADPDLTARDPDD